MEIRNDLAFSPVDDDRRYENGDHDEDVSGNGAQLGQGLQLIWKIHETYHSKFLIFSLFFSLVKF